MGETPMPRKTAMTQQSVDLQTYLQQVHRQIQLLQIQVVRANQLAAAAKAELDLQRAGRTARNPVEFTAQYGEDLVLWNLLDHQGEGFFIEAGAFDGYRYSVTYALECIGWRGLLVEALPEAAERCRQRRTASRVVQSALSKPGSPQSATFTVLQDQYGGMLSYLKASEQHLRDTSWAAKQTITVPVTTLDALLADHSGPIDVVVLDLEGGELDALAGSDLERFKPRILMIEDNTHGRDPGIANFMSRFPYELAWRVAVNQIYVRKDEKDLLERAKWMQNG